MPAPAPALLQGSSIAGAKRGVNFAAFLRERAEAGPLPISNALAAGNGGDDKRSGFASAPKTDASPVPAQNRSLVPLNAPGNSVDSIHSITASPERISSELTVSTAESGIQTREFLVRPRAESAYPNAGSSSAHPVEKKKGAQAERAILQTGDSTAAAAAAQPPMSAALPVAEAAEYAAQSASVAGGRRAPNSAAQQEIANASAALSLSCANSGTRSSFASGLASSLAPALPAEDPCSLGKTALLAKNGNPTAPAPSGVALDKAGTVEMKTAPNNSAKSASNEPAKPALNDAQKSALTDMPKPTLTDAPKSADAPKPSSSLLHASVSSAGHSSGQGSAALPLALTAAHSISAGPSHIEVAASGPAPVATLQISAPARAHVPSPVAAAQGNLYDKIDQGSAPVMLHSGPQHIAVGMRDPNLGWVEIKTQSAGGHLDASLVTGSGQTHASLAAQLPALSEYLQQRDVRVATLSVHHEMPAAIANQNSGSGGGAGAQTCGQAGPGSSGSGGGGRQRAILELTPMRSSMPVYDDPRPMSYISVRA